MPIAASDWKQIDPTSQSVPVTMASAATIAPTTFMTVLTGNIAIANITPPVLHAHLLCIVFAGVAGVAAGGNIANVKASVASEGMLLAYNPATAKYTAIG